MENLPKGSEGETIIHSTMVSGSEKKKRRRKKEKKKEKKKKKKKKGIIFKEKVGSVETAPAVLSRHQIFGLLWSGGQTVSQN